MKAPSKPMEQLWHPSSLLAYDSPMIPNPQDDFDSITSEAKSTGDTTTDLYDRSLTSRRCALAGVVCTSIFSIGCIIAGSSIIAHPKPGYYGEISYYLTNGKLSGEMLSLTLNLIVTLCTESTGLVHSISLRSALASESRLRFNTNLRLLTAARGWRNPNGSLLNGVMAVLLTLSYTSASLVILPSGTVATIDFDVIYSVYITGFPLLLLGIVMLLQVVIALSGMCAVKILTWSSSPFDVTAALVHHAQLTSVPLRCMCNLDVGGSPSRPSEIQPSAWRAHPSIRKVIIFLWGLVVACAGWAVLATIIWNIFYRESGYSVPKGSWSFFPNQASQVLFDGGADVQWWILTFVTVGLVQGPLTLGLHCSELIVNVIRDERRWRRATWRRGLEMTTNPLKSFFTDPLNLVLFAAKPILHWMFGISFKLSIEQVNYFEGLSGGVITMRMYIAQIGNLCIALFIFACFFTIVALFRPRGPQPVAYGHLQTLANLVDEWSPVMWWGHKEDEIPYCHAGTSDHPLPPVKMDCVYAGSGVSFHPFVSPLGSHLQTYT
ncbi:hypothetical protein M405DRAFT_257269 [Rhizopogon salebrosus TDB-379]|nr:hypothetical protein M405DRAFT_257269 [Rhizopogon salebrosus TDB-379]